MLNLLVVIVLSSTFAAPWLFVGASRVVAIYRGEFC